MHGTEQSAGTEIGVFAWHHVTEQKRGLTHDTGGHSQITDHDHRMLLHHRTFDVALSTI